MSCLSFSNDCILCLKENCRFAEFETGATVCVESELDLDGTISFRVGPGSERYCPILGEKSSSGATAMIGENFLTASVASTEQ
jgi:hypothetical protein